MKKFTYLFVITLLAFSLTACQKKGATSTAVNSSNVAQEALPASAGSLAAAASTTASASGSSSSSTSDQPKSYQQIDSYVDNQEMIDESYKTNYKTALADAQRALKGSAKYCGVIVKFYGAQLTTQNIEQFLFYNDDFSQDYYWLVELNSYGTVKKTRSFIARRDIASDVKCITATSDSLSSFASIYSQFTQVEKFKLIDPGIIAETKLYPMNTGWNINVIDNAGTVAANEIINSTSAAASVTTKKTVTVTPEALETDASTDASEMF